MSKHIDNINHNSYYDPVTLSGTCTYVNVKDGCTGTISDCNYIEIGENNTGLSLANVNYCTVGNNNTNVSIADSDYIIVGSDNLNIQVGTHTNTRFTGRTGGNSIIVGHKVIATEITGENIQTQRTRNGAVDGTFNDIKGSGMVVLDKANGNTLDNAKKVDITETNNNTVSTANLTLVKRDAFLDYALVDKVTRVESRKRKFDKQSDASGTILDTQSDELINIAKDAAPKGGGTAPKETYSLVQGLWSLNEKRINTI